MLVWVDCANEISSGPSKSRECLVVREHFRQMITPSGDHIVWFVIVAASVVQEVDSLSSQPGLLVDMGCLLSFCGRVIRSALFALNSNDCKIVH